MELVIDQHVNALYNYKNYKQALSIICFLNQKIEMMVILHSHLIS